MSTYKLIFTNVGLSKIQNAELNGNFVDIEEFAVGDGAIKNLEPSMTGLLGEKYRGLINQVSTTNGVTSFDLIVPSEEGGFYIREVALFDVDGDCICIGTVPVTYKVNPNEGASKPVHIRVSTSTSNVDNLELAYDNSQVYVNYLYVDDKLNQKVDKTAEISLIGDVTGNANFDESGNISIQTTIKNGVPTGIISMWSGSISSIPAGWALCDGTKGTPDLRNRFIIGASTDVGGVSNTAVTGANTKLGGSKDAIVVSHTHTQAAHSHGGSTSWLGDHAHNYQWTVNSAQLAPGASWYSLPYQQFATSFAGGHNHSISTDSQQPAISSAGQSGTNANLPPYYALAYIMKL